MAGSDATLAAAVERVRQGQLHAAGLAEVVSGVMMSSGLQAIALQPVRAVAGQAPWFDSSFWNKHAYLEPVFSAVYTHGIQGSVFRVTAERPHDSIQHCAGSKTV